jgi:O-antigen/teichoic acid export membrane protein
MKISSHTSGRLLARNTLWNLLGQGAPLVVAVFVLPLLIQGLGIDRYGVLSLVWALIGYFSFLDLGLGRALTKLVAERLGNLPEERLAAEIWTAWLLMLGLGVAGSLVLATLAPCLVHSVLKIPSELHSETLHAVYLLAGTMPLVLTSAGLTAILAAHQRFGFINAVAIPQGICSIIGPLFVLPFSHSIFAMVSILALVRLATWLAYLGLCFRVMPVIGRTPKVNQAAVMPLLRIGSWMTISNVVGPLMMYLDRFFLGALVSMAAVAYYTTPYDVVTKLLIIPGALVSVLFPAFSASLAGDRARATRLFGRGATFMLLALFPLSLLAVTLAQPALTLWLGTAFAQHSTHVLQWLAVGVFINSLAQVAFALVQAAGRPDLTAKLHLAELPCYIVAIWFLIRADGIEGAAIAWVGRIFVDTTALFLLAKRLLPESNQAIRKLAVGVVAVLALLGFGAMPFNLAWKGLFLLVTLASFAVVAWMLVLDDAERAVVRKWLRLRNLP